MPHKDGIHIEEEELPGIGLRDDFLTEKGRRVGVITHRDGHRDLLVYSKGDPDSVAETVSLTEGEADILAEYLGTRRVVQRLSRITEQIEGLQSATLVVKTGDGLVGKPIGEANIRRRTGCSVVAIWRGNEVTASPLPDFVIESGDKLVVVGTEDAIAAARLVVSGG